MADTYWRKYDSNGDIAVADVASPAASLGGGRGDLVRICNMGPFPIRVKLGGPTVLATTADEGLNIQTEYMDRNSLTHYSVMGVGGTANYSISVGDLVLAKNGGKLS